MTKKKTKKKKVKKKPPAKPPANKQSAPEVVPYPSAGPKVKDFEDQLDRQLAGDAASPRRGPGRPRKDAQPVEPDPAGPAIELVVNFVKLPFELWQIRVPQVEGLALTENEAKQIAEPTRELIEYYLPKIPPIAYAWASLGVAGFWIMRTRLLSIEEYKKRSQGQDQNSPPQPAAKPKDRKNTAHGGAGPSGQGITIDQIKKPNQN